MFKKFMQIITRALPETPSVLQLSWRHGVAVECRTRDQEVAVRVSAGHYGK